MKEQFSRTEMLLGEAAVARLRASRVAVFGVGGVGSFVVEALARAGVGALELVDDDQVAVSNLNRQIIALHSTLGQYKVDTAAARVADICPDTAVTARRVFFGPETAAQFDFSGYDYVVDAIDSVSGKIELAVRCAKVGTPLISCMGAGNKLDPTRFQVADLYETTVCPLARVMRRELRKRGITRLKVVYSTEPPLATPPPNAEGPGSARRSTPGSVSFVPSVAGLILAGEVIRDLIATSIVAPSAAPPTAESEDP